MNKNRRPHRRTFASAVLALTAVGILSQAAACRSDPSPAAGPSPGASVSATPPAPPSAPSATIHSYKSVRNACDVLDQNLLVDVLGPDGGDLGTPRSEDTSFASFARCQHQYGQPGQRGLISIDVMTVKRATAQTYYQGVRGAQQKTDKVTDVPGLGQGAYRYTDPQTGPHLVVYAGNLYLALTILGQGSAPADPATKDRLLEQLARSAMTTLTA